MNSIAGTGTALAGGTLTVNVSGSVQVGDQIIVTITCPATGTTAFDAGTTVSGSGTWTPTEKSSGNCGTADDVLVLTAGATATNPVLTLNPEYDTTGAAPGTVALSGVYVQLGSTTSFSVPADASVLWYSVTSNIPPVTLASSTTGQSISNISLTQPGNIPTPATNAIGGTVGTSTGTFAAGTGGLTSISPTSLPDATVGVVYPITTFSAVGGTVTSWAATGLPAGLTLSTSGVLSGTPTAGAAAGSVVVTATTALGPSTETFASFTSNDAPTVTFALTGTGDTWAGTPSVTQAATLSGTGTANLVLTPTSLPSTGTATLYQLSNLQVSTGSVAGAVDVTITLQNYSGTTAATPVTLATDVSVGSTLGASTRIYGPDGTADGTVAQEFETAFPANATTSTGGSSTVVLATDAPNTNGADALSASYLEGMLGTGLLITPPNTFGTDAQTAMRIEGVQTVYVVGGPLAITSAVISQIEATPAYKPGGITSTGSDLKVVGPIYGQTAADTAQKIATYFGASYGSVPAISGAYSAATTTTGGGLYNDTTGNSSATGPSSSTPTAIVISESDWQDAMSVAPEAYALHLPVILTPATSLGTQASAALTTLGAKQVIVIGGQLALTSNVVTSIQALNGGISVLRIAGQDATDTAGKLASFALSTGGANTGLGWTSSAVLASHANYWSDALGAAALGGGANATFGLEPMVLVENPTTIGTYTPGYLKTFGGMTVHQLTVLGGTLAMPVTMVNSLLASLAGA